MSGEVAPVKRFLTALAIALAAVPAMVLLRQPVPAIGRMYSVQQVGRVHVVAVAALHTTVVADLGAGARCTRLVAAGDDLYVLDDAAAHVRRYILHGLPHALQVTQVMRWREGDNGLIMGRPLDLFLAGERLLILDGLGSLWSYWGPSYARVLVPLRLQSNQGAPVAVALHEGNLLLLDDSRQVWSYAPVAGGYDTVPRAALPRRLTGAPATRLGVTARSLLALHADGTLTAYPWGRAAAAAAAAAAPHIPLAITGLWADAARARFLATAARELAIVGADGAVRWRAAVDGLDGETLRDVALSPSGQLYLLTGTRILLVTARVPAL